jgi:hypothetical protein
MTLPERCGICNEPTEPTHSIREIKGHNALNCPSFREFILDGRDFLPAEEVASLAKRHARRNAVPTAGLTDEGAE